MTGPEKQDLALVLRLLDDFKGDLSEIKSDVKGLDNRLQKMEMKDVAAVAVASTTAAIAATNSAKLERRQVGVARLFAIVASAVGTGVSIAIALHTLGVF